MLRSDGRARRFLGFLHAARWLVPLPGLLVVAACGGGKSGSGGTGGQASSSGAAGGVSPEAAFQSALQAAFCGAAAPCCAKTFDKSACESDVAAMGSVIPQGKSAATGSFDASAAAACLTALAAAAGQCDPDLAKLGAAWDTCQTVYPGTKKLGEVCTQATDCVAVPSSTRGCPGTVCTYDAIQVVSPVGGPCGNMPAPGQPLYVCDPTKYQWCDASTGKCAAPVPAGGSCDNGTMGSAACVTGYACVGENGPPKCIVGHMLGDACWPPGCDIASDPMLCACGTGTTCDSGNTDVCVADAMPGDPCPDVGGTCLGTCVSGTCVTYGQAATWAPYCG